MKKVILLCIIMLICISSFVSADLTDGLVSVFTFDNTTNWLSNEVDDIAILTIGTGDPTNVSGGMNGNMVDFDGNDGIAINNSVLPTGNISISGWIRFDSTIADTTFFNSYSGSTYHFTSAIYANGLLYFMYADGGAVTFIEPINAATWYHFVMIENNTGGFWYMDGVLINSSTTSQFPISYAAIGLGVHRAQDRHFLDGQIDEMYWWNRSLTEAEIIILASDTPVGYYPFPPPVDTTPPNITKSTYNHTTAINETQGLIWRTDINLESITEDPTPSIAVNLTKSGNCSIGIADLNHSEMTSDFGNPCATTDTIEMLCTSNETFALSVGNQQRFITCVGDNAVEGETSTSGGLNITLINSCTYTSGDWNVECSDNCSITSPINLGGNNILISGAGTFQTTVDITNYATLKIVGTSSTNRCEAKCLGGCFKK